MDDLNGLDWSAASNNTQPSKVPPGTGNYYPALRPTPPPANSGRATPLSSQGSGAPKAFAPAKNTASDSFSNLVSFGSAKANTLTLQQQQAKLQEEKRRKEEEQRKQYDAQFGSSQFWDGLGDKGKGVAGLSPVPSPNPVVMGQAFASPFSSTISPPPASNGADLGGDDDLFAAFNKDTKVDNSSHYPPPSASPRHAQTSGFASANKGPDLSSPQAWEQPASKPVEFGDDDDPFGLGQMKPPSSAPAPVSTLDDDDDFLGDLGKPVEEVKRAAPPIPEIRAESSDSEDNSDDPWDKAVAELVEMGFSAEQSRRALTESGSGLDIQAAAIETKSQVKGPKSRRRFFFEWGEKGKGNIARWEKGKCPCVDARRREDSIFTSKGRESVTEQRIGLYKDCCSCGK
ncbi:hypothetical protein CJF30_00008759 [Rutstroemia sp. NJR-2017a BBW]|nr:hypothetical protein CJF30_00008759 [Rutstroemia sp. NJR-2017a BBW]